MGENKKTDISKKQKVSTQRKKTSVKKNVQKTKLSGKKTSSHFQQKIEKLLNRNKKKSKKKVQTPKVEISRELILAIVIILIGIIAIIGTTYAAFSTLVKGNKAHSVVAGTFTVKFTEGENIQLNNAYPISDAKGLATTPYTFTIENTGTIDAMYRIKFEEDTTNPKNMVPKNKIKVSYKKGTSNYTSPQLLSSLEEGLILVTDETLLKNEKVSYEIKMWIDESAGNEIMGKTYKTKVVVEAVQKVGGKYADTIPPIISLNGEENISLTKGSTYTDSGVKSVVDGTDGTIATSKVTKKIEYYNGTTTTTVSSVNTNNIGVYYITYKVKDSSNNEGLAVRTININEVDSTPPVITLTGTTNMTLMEGNAYTEGGYSATDATDGDITNRVVVINPVNIHNPGVYIIKYIVQDDSGNIASKTRTVTVIKAADESCFTFNNGKITDYSDTCPKDVIIPKTINGTDVTSIGQNAFSSNQLTSVRIPEGVTSIEQDAFSSNQLTSITVPSTVTWISPLAFANNQLTSVELSEGLKTIDAGAFRYNQLIGVVIPSSVIIIGDSAFRDNQLMSVIIKGKSSSSNFEEYPRRGTPFGWASGYSDSNITWNG